MRLSYCSERSSLDAASGVFEVGELEALVAQFRLVLEVIGDELNEEWSSLG